MEKEEFLKSLDKMFDELKRMAGEVFSDLEDGQKEDEQN